MAPGVDGSAGAKPGVLLRTIRRLIMREAMVSRCEDLGNKLRLISLEGPQLRGVEWQPGQKVQIAFGASFMTRTYTPIEWDAGAGRTRILAYAHGDAPGSRWTSNATPGDRCDLLGPRSSLDVGQVPSSPLALFGDETSLALGYALRSGGHSLSCFFEVTDVVEVRQAVDRVGLFEVELFGREQDDTHLAAMEARLASLADGGAAFVLTGRAPAIQRWRQTLRRLDVPSSRVITKAYWSPGKTGLD